MKISKTFQVITFESAENGEAADSGFEYDSTEMTVDDLLREMGRFVEASQYPYTVKDMRSHFWFTEYDSDTDLNTGAVTNYSWHIDSATDLELKKLFILLNRRK